jgi:nicotinate-nucleotide pyrophosphorylase (carboxylating)
MTPQPTDLHFPTENAVALVRTALEEDLGPDHLDVTTLATIPAEQVQAAEVVARADGVLAGAPAIAVVFAAVAGLIGVRVPTVDLLVEDGAAVTAGDVVARVAGPIRAVLVGERTMLNILCRLSGVATHTRRWADALDGTGAMVLDTRKTTPGMRHLEKYAVRAGGGTNKRMGLYDVAMIKDNHKLAAGSVSAAYNAVHTAYPAVDIQIEVTTVAEAEEAYAAGARFIMCDNMGVGLLRETVKALRDRPERVEIEATGGLTLEVARDYALTGVDYLSVGALTHSAPILDLALDLVDTDVGTDIRTGAGTNLGARSRD